MPRPTLQIPTVLQVTVLMAAGACASSSPATDAAVTDMPVTDVTSVSTGDGGPCSVPMDHRQCLTRCASLGAGGLQFSACEQYCDTTTRNCYDLHGQMTGCEQYDNLDAGPYAFC